MNHKKRHFKSLEEKDVKQRCYCIFCPRKFNWKSKLSKHILLHTCQSSKLYNCSFCKKQFLLLSSLTEHVLSDCFDAREHRVKVIMKETGLKRRNIIIPYRCKYCGAVCSTKFNLNRHYKQHKLQCTFCFMIFANRASLAEHLTSQHMDIVG